MENVVDALKLAAWVLIFVLALSISISAFGQAKTASDTIISYRDRENNFFYVENTGNSNRKVGIETIIPSIYRAFRENYKIKFSETIYKKFDSEKKKDIEKDYIDINELSASYSADKEKDFIKYLLYDKEQKAEFEDITPRGIYNIVKDKMYIEKLGYENGNKIITYTN